MTHCGLNDCTNLSNIIDIMNSLTDDPGVCSRASRLRQCIRFFSFFLGWIMTIFHCFFLSRVAKTQLNHSTRRVVRTHLIMQDFLSFFLGWRTSNLITGLRPNANYRKPDIPPKVDRNVSRTLKRKVVDSKECVLAFGVCELGFPEKSTEYKSVNFEPREESWVCVYQRLALVSGWSAPK